MSESKHTPKTITVNQYLSRSQIDCDFGVDCGHRSEMGGARLDVVHKSGRQHDGQIVIFGDTQPEDNALVVLLINAPKTLADHDRLAAENAELRGALGSYGRHSHDCEIAFQANPSPQPSCICGYDDNVLPFFPTHQPTADTESEDS